MVLHKVTRRRCQIKAHKKTPAAAPLCTHEAHLIITSCSLKSPQTKLTFIKVTGLECTRRIHQTDAGHRPLFLAPPPHPPSSLAGSVLLTPLLTSNPPLTGSQALFRCFIEHLKHSHSPTQPTNAPRQRISTMLSRLVLLLFLALATLTLAHAHPHHPHTTPAPAFIRRQAASPEELASLLGVDTTSGVPLPILLGDPGAKDADEASRGYDVKYWGIGAQGSTVYQVLTTDASGVSE